MMMVMMMMMINLPLRTLASSQSVGLATVYSRMHSRHEKHKTVSKHWKRTIVIEHMQVKYRTKDKCEISNRIFHKIPRKHKQKCMSFNNTAVHE